MPKVKQITAVILAASFILGGIMSGFLNIERNPVKPLSLSNYQIEEVISPPTETPQ